MKALTAFRRRIRRRGKIKRTCVKALLCSDNVLEFRVRFEVEPNSNSQDALYTMFRAARQDAEKFLDENPEF